jgi:hypothetical protein
VLNDISVVDLLILALIDDNISLLNNRNGRVYVILSVGTV